MKEILYLTTHSTHFIYGQMALGIWLRITQIPRQVIEASSWATLTKSQHENFHTDHPTDRTVHTMVVVTPVMKEIFYLTMYSTYFMGIWHHTYGKGPFRYQERKPAAITTWVTLSNQQQGIFYIHHPTGRIAHTTAFATPIMEHWLKWEIAQWVHHEVSIWLPIAQWANALTTELYLTPQPLWSTGLTTDKWSVSIIPKVINQLTWQRVPKGMSFPCWAHRRHSRRHIPLL